MGITTVVFFGRDDATASSDAAPSAAAPSVSTEGFARADPRPIPPVEIPGSRPPEDEAVKRFAVGTTADLVLGQGRAAILDIGMKPLAFRVSREMEVVPVPP